MFHAPSASRLALFLFLLAPLARGGEESDKRVCLSTYVEAQAARQDSRLRASRHALEQCGRQVCPALIRNDCVLWLREVTDAMPTVVLSATGPDGRDQAHAHVSLDGAPLTYDLDGRPLPVDPGEHVFRFALPGSVDVEQRIVVREGEKDREIRAVFPRAAAAASSAPEPAATRRPIPASVWVLGGVGLTSLVVSATFAGLGWFGSPGWDSSQSCRPNCAPGDVNVVKEHFEVADVAGALALVSLGATAYLFFARPSERSSAPPVSFTLAPGTLGVSYEGRF